MSDPQLEPVDHLASWYDDETLARIDAALTAYDQDALAPELTVPTAPAIMPTPRSRQTAAGIALTVAALTGVKDATDPEPDEIFEEIDPGFDTEGEQFVTLFFVPGDPKASRAIVRPWLAPSALGNKSGI